MKSKTTKAAGKASLDPLVRRPDGVTREAQRQCAVWLSECKKLGWSNATLDRLENVWWDHHDRLGNWIPSNVKVRVSE